MVPRTTPVRPSEDELAFFYGLFGGEARKKKEEIVMANVTCVVCEGTISVASDVMEGELLLCPDCGTELEVVGLSPLRVQEAPEVQEDWGE